MLEQAFAQRIHEQEALGKRSAMEMAEIACSIGKILINAKAKLGRGRFGRWADVTLHYTPQHRDWLMRVARRWDELKPRIEDGSSVSQAMRSLTAPGAGVERPAAAQPDALTVLRRVMATVDNFADKFREDEVIEAIQRLGSTDLTEIVDAALRQRKYWAEISEQLRLLTAQRVEARQPNKQAKLPMIKAMAVN